MMKTLKKDMMKPKKPKADQLIAFRLTEELLKKLERLAKETNRSVSSVIVYILEKNLE